MPSSSPGLRRPPPPAQSVAAVQAPSGPGTIVLDGTTGTALSAGGGIHLNAGTGGIVDSGGDGLATAGPVTLDTVGGIGTASGRILFDAAATPASIAIGGTTAPDARVYLGGLGSLILGGVHTTNAALDVTAAANLNVAPGVMLETGLGSLALAAGTNPDGTASLGGGTLAIGSESVVASTDTGADAIGLRGTAIDIDTSFFPAIIGSLPAKGGGFTPSAGGVVLRGARSDETISVGPTTGTGLDLSDAELAQIFTIAGGTVTFGDPTQTGAITFAGATPATTAGASVAAVQSPTGPGAIVLDGTSGTALAVAGGGAIHLNAGAGGIVANGGASSLATTGPVTLDTSGGVGTASGRILIDAAAMPAGIAIGGTTAPGGGVYLGGLGNLALGRVQTTNAALDVTANDGLTVIPGAVLETGKGSIALAAGTNPDSTAGGSGVLTVGDGADVATEDTGVDAITLRGTDVNVATGDNPAIVAPIPPGSARPPPPRSAG